MTDFSKIASIAQESIDYYFKSKNNDQYVNNVYPLSNVEENKVFNYWWIAHLVDVRIDAYIRTNEKKYLNLAEETYCYNKKRNHGTLLHEYYDDMLWNALAALRLYNITSNKEYLNDAEEVCQDIFNTGWNESMYGGFAWKRTQLDYKNTPVNGPIIILALRLFQINKNKKYLEISKKTLDWLRKFLVDKNSQFVEDGINRNQDGKIDTQWKFTYNQGVYIGALVEFYHVTKESSYLDDAITCAKTSLKELVREGVFQDNGDGGDIGLFKGIEYRYLAQLYKETKESFIKEFIHASCDILQQNTLKDNYMLMYRDWTLEEPPSYIYLSDQLSGVMALESAATLN